MLPFAKSANELLFLNQEECNAMDENSPKEKTTMGRLAEETEVVDEICGAASPRIEPKR